MFNKRLYIFLFLVGLFLTVANGFQITSTWDDIEVFTGLNGFFISYGIAVIFLDTYNHEYKTGKGFMSSPVLTFALMLYGGIGFAYVINRFEEFGFQKEVLFEQIVILFYGLVVTAELVHLHVKLIKRRDEGGESVV